MINQLIFINVQHINVAVTCLHAQTLFLWMKFACSKQKTKQLTPKAFPPS